LLLRVMTVLLMVTSHFIRRPSTKLIVKTDVTGSFATSFVGTVSGQD
jgi:hypothetical protein